MSLPVCKFYELNQTCRFGNNCKFYHSQRPPPLSIKSTLDHDLSGSGIVSSSESALLNSDHTGKPNSETCFQHDLSSLERNSVEATHTKQPSFPHKTGNGPYDQRQICSHFARGFCRYGRNCKFIHRALPPRLRQSDKHDTAYPNCRDLKPEKDACLESREDNSTNRRLDSSNAGLHERSSVKVKAADTTLSASSSNQNGKQQRQTRKICTYYQSGRCKKGVSCKFLHRNGTPAKLMQDVSSDARSIQPDNEISAPSKDAISKSDNPIPNQQRKIYSKNQHPFNSQFLKVFNLSELDETGRAKLRSEEIEAIKRRFPKDKIFYKYDGDIFQANIKFTPSDPDWPFDVKEFTLGVEIPQSYPKQVLKVTLSPDQNLPKTVQRYVEVSIEEWITERQEQLAQQEKVELLFRPFLRWFDRSIEEITTGALLQLKRELTAKAVGFEFIPARKLQEKFNAVKLEETPVEEDKKEVESDPGESDDSSESEEEDQDSSTDEETDVCSKNQSLELQPQQRGTEISLKYLQLKENAAALLFQRLKLILQCSRCKGHADLYVTQGNVMSMSCNKCNQDMYVTYRPGLLHQFSSVLGYLDVDGCQAFDIVLQDCRASVSCMACNKQTTIDGIVTGQVVSGWCKACNAKFKLATESVKLTQLAPSGIDTSSAPVIKATSSKPKKPPKDPAIREGYPLPDFGTCKHYKQSYRWLRFPCCGKAYPCDICHDKKEDHEMTLANRMICGHCCKEQNYSASRPCTGCGEHMTKVRSAHWEGGSGCRDKISMSKGDTQKYKNMNKTVSNKKKMESGNKKKNTKLRHA